MNSVELKVLWSFLLTLREIFTFAKWTPDFKYVTTVLAHEYVAKKFRYFFEVYLFCDLRLFIWCTK